MPWRPLSNGGADTLRHHFIDEYSDGGSFIHRLDPRAKLAGLLMFILFVISTPPDSFICFALYGALICGLILLSGIPPAFMIKRSLCIFPFVFLVAMFIPFFREGEIVWTGSFGPMHLAVTRDGLMVFWNVLSKGYLSVLCLILLMSSTGFVDLLKGMERLKLPGLFIMILSFMYRYIFLVEDELMIMKRAKDSRSTGGSRWFHIRALANIIGVLFIKSYERAENVYLAMCSRGFNGCVNTLNVFRLRAGDWGFLVTLAGVLAGIRFAWG